jgi:hypothetical protein
MSSYASSCPWCGRSLLLSAFTQLVGLGIAVGVGLMLTGIVSWDELKSAVHLRGILVGDVRPPGGEVVETADRPRGGGGVRAVAPGSASRERKTPAKESRREPRARKSGITIGVGCDSTARAEALRRLHPDWPEWVRRTAGCGQVAVDFDSEQVKASLGEPDSIVRDGAGREVWIYGTRRIELRRGRVAAVSR